MAVELATGYIDLVPSAQDIASKIAKELDLDAVAVSAGNSAGQKLADGLLGQAKDGGAKLAAALGLTAVGALAIKSAETVESANNIIIRSTGATGAAADQLEESFRKVASGSSASLETVATTLSELYQRTGLQGKALEALTTQVVTFNRISKDSPITVDQLTKATAGFNVQGSQMGGVLDHLFQISQRTGVPLSQLLSDVASGGPILRQFGFNIEFSANFLAQLNKAGVDANQILPGLKRVLTDAAKAGKDPADALHDVLTQLDGLIKSGDELGARNLAVQIFGNRGVGLVDAALSGKLSLQTLDEQVKLTGSGIVDTAGKTSTLSGTLGILRNNATLALAGFATPALQTANDALKSILPTVRDISTEFAGLPDPLKLGTVAAVGLAFSLGKVGDFITNAGPGIKSIGDVASDAFTLGAVKALEMGDAIKAASATELLLGGGFALAAAGAVTLALALANDTNRLTEAESAAKKWGQTTITAAKSSKDAEEDLSVTLGQLKTRQRQLADEHSFLNDKVALTEAVYGKLGDEVQRDAEEFLRNKDRIAQLTPELDKLAQKRRDEGAAARETAGALDQYVLSTERGTNASSALSTLTDDAKKALDGLQSALIQAAGGEVGYQQAIISRDEAQDRANGTFLAVLTALQNLHDAQAEFGDDSDQARAAQDALAAAVRDDQKAQLDLKQANLLLGQQTIALTDNQSKLLDSLGLVGKTRDEQLSGIDAEIAKYQQLQRDYPATADSLNPYIFQLLVLKQKVSDVEGPHAVGVNVAFSDWATQAEALAAFINSLPGNENSVVDPLGFLAPHATGGIFTRPHVGLVAEAGPEAILPLTDPRRSWTLIAQAGLLASSSAPREAGASGAAPLIGQLILQQPIDDPISTAVETARNLRAASVLAAL